MRKLLIGTRNAGKLPEIKKDLSGLPFEIIGLDDVKNIPKDFEVEETGSTFEENAILKAKGYGKMSGLLTLAEDAGLSVDALDGRPGVYSARYADGNDEDRYMKLLSEMEGIDNRAAHFVASMAIYDPTTDRLETCEGIYDGVIANEAVGENGFGYDPIFYNEQLEKTNAQMSIEEKNSVSHRGKAIRKARELLTEMLE